MGWNCGSVVRLQWVAILPSPHNSKVGLPIVDIVKGGIDGRGASGAHSLLHIEQGQWCIFNADSYAWLATVCSLHASHAPEVD